MIRDAEGIKVKYLFLRFSTALDLFSDGIDTTPHFDMSKI